MKMSFRGSFGNSDQLRDLGVAVAFDIVKNKNGSCLGWKQGDRLFEVDPYVWTVGRPGAGQRFQVLYSCLSVCRSRLGSQLAQNDIDRYTMKPGRERAATVEGRKLLPGSDKGILGHIFGSCRILDQPETQRIYLALVSFEKLLEGLQIALLGSGYDFTLSHGPRGSRAKGRERRGE
jgi:hypothetical protein